MRGFVATGVLDLVIDLGGAWDCARLLPVMARSELGGRGGSLRLAGVPVGSWDSTESEGGSTR